SSVLQRDVRVGNVDISLAQGSMAIDRIEIAGDQEGIDALSMEHAAFDIALSAFLMNRTHIENIAIKGMGFDTPATLKKEPATPSKKQKTAKEGSGLTLPAFELPTPASVIAKADLKSIKAYNQAQKEIGEIIAKWDKVAKNDLSADALADLQKDFETLQKTSTSKDPQQLLKLKDDITSFTNKVKAQQKSIKSLQEAFNADRNRLEQLYKTVNQASAEDYNHLKSTYSLDSNGALNIVGLLLSDRIKTYLARGTRLYAMVAPHLASEPKPPVPPRGQGRWMKYPLTGPSPNLWIAKTAIDGTLNKQSFSASINDISDNQQALGRPVTLSAASDGPQISKLVISGEDNRLGNTVIDRLTFESKGVRLGRLDLDQIQIAKSRMAFKGNIALADMATMSGSSTFALSDVTMAMNGNDKTAKLLGEVLRSINAFKANVTVAGSLHAPQVAVNTDIDTQLSKALTAGLQSQISQYQNELKTMLAKQSADQLASLKASAGGLVDINGLAGDQSKALGGLSSDAGSLLTKGGIGGALKGIRPF
ncbi:MAG: TIGR03545 family protein, partial [Proteobacteria bacterium]|nr:TIGR03545 family protein [Pseudomonadota bacterium]